MSSPLSPPYVTHAGNQTLYLAANTPIVNTLQALTGSVSLTSPDSSITITPSGQSIQLQTVIPSTISTISNPNPSFSTITMAPVGGGNGSINFATEGLLTYHSAFGIVDDVGNSLNVVYQQAPNGVSTFVCQIDEQIWNGNSSYMGIGQDNNQYIWNGASGKTVLVSPTSISSFTVSSINGVAFFPAAPGVTSLNTVTGAVTLTSPDASITITPSGQDIQLQAVAPVQPFDTEGLQNKVGIFPVTPVVSATLLASGQITPTSYVPDGTIPTSSTTPEGTPCWLYTKPPALTGFNYYPYNPRFGNPAAPLPYNKANTGTRLKTLWALIQPVVNIYTSGTIALNVYSYDPANPPTTGFYNTRWAYSNTAGVAAGTTGINLFANYTYLVYAYDAPRTTNILGVGQPDNQNWGLRDPYDIYTGVHHIPLQNVVVAFNPWTDGTNYLTWNSSTAYVIGQTVVYSGTSVNPNGLFYTCVANNNNQAPVSATGIPNTTHWSAISPQPSSYASQPVLSININGISGTTGTWTTGNMLRVLSMGYSVGSSPTSTTASYEYVLI
jgi:hypothetical protein